MGTLLSRQEAFEKKGDDKFASLDKRVSSLASDNKAFKDGKEEDDLGIDVDSGDSSLSDGDSDQFVVSTCTTRTTSLIEHRSRPPFQQSTPLSPLMGLLFFMREMTPPQ